MPETSRQRTLIPAVATALALAYLAAVALGPWALATVVAAAAVAGCALVLARRTSPGLRAALVALAIWLAAGLGGALLLRGRPLSGLVWVLLVVYLLPLPAVPFLYARTFDDSERQVKGKREKGQGTADAAQGRARRWSSLFAFPSSLFPPTSRHGQAQGSGPESAPAPGGTR